MSRSLLDPFDGVVPFVATAEALSFRKAARALGVTTSAVSKAISKLESEVGVRLLNRSSRCVSLTTDGEAFLASCRDAVSQLRTARALVSAAQHTPQGLLRTSLPSMFARRVVAELPALLALHPALSVEVTLTDRFVQLADENIDVAVRIGTVEDTQCVGCRLRALRLVTVASPRYLKERGEPRLLEDLSRHNCMKYVLPSGLERSWLFAHAGVVSTLKVAGSFKADHGEPLLASAVAGLGLVQAPDILIADELARGELVEVLSEHAAPGPPLTALCAPGRQHSPKVLAFVGVVRGLCAHNPVPAGPAAAAVSRQRSRASPPSRTR